MNKQIFALMLSTILCSTGHVIAMDVDLEPTGIPVSHAIAMHDVELKSTGVTVIFETNPDNSIDVITDDNADANYQARSGKVPVASGQSLRVYYDVEVLEGIMSIGLLNTNCNGWYGLEEILSVESTRALSRGSFPKVRQKPLS